MQGRSALAGLMLLGIAFAPGAAAADRPSVERVPVVPGVAEPEEGSPERQNRPIPRGCIDADAIAGAVVTSERTIELTLRNGARWRMRFADDCPALSYYQGFYYRRTEAGRLCADRDAVIARSGSECLIDKITPMKSKKNRGKRD